MTLVIIICSTPMQGYVGWNGSLHGVECIIKMGQDPILNHAPVACPLH